MKHCAKCLLPQTHETITYDDKGVCNVCRQIENKDFSTNWEERRVWLDEMISKVRGKYQYDCIVPYSGGKDSVYQLWYVVTQLKMIPLVVRFNHWGFRPLIEENNQNVFKQLGVDVVDFQPNWHIVKDLMLESLKRTGDFCWHCHTGIFGRTMQVALQYKVPLVFFGESTAEYNTHVSFEEIQGMDAKVFNSRIGLGITVDEMYKALGGKYERRQLKPYAYPDEGELEAGGIVASWLGNYIPWDTRHNVEIIKKELDWKGQDVEGIPPEYDYEKIECKWQGVRDYCRYIKRGYGRTSHLVAIDARHGNIGSKEGQILIDRYDGKRPKSLNLFLSNLGISEDEFYQILQSHEVPPWHFDKTKVVDGAELHDMKNWNTRT